MDYITADKDNPLVQFSSRALRHFGSLLQTVFADSTSDDVNGQSAILSTIRGSKMHTSIFSDSIICDSIPAHIFDLDEDLNHTQYIITYIENCMNIKAIHAKVQSCTAKDKILNFLKSTEIFGQDTLPEYLIMIHIDELDEDEHYIFTSDHCMMPESVFENLQESFEDNPDDYSELGRRNDRFVPSSDMFSDCSDEDDYRRTYCEDLDSDDEEYLSSTVDFDFRTESTSVNGKTETDMTSHYRDDLGPVIKRQVLVPNSFGELVDRETLHEGSLNQQNGYTLLESTPVLTGDDKNSNLPAGFRSSREIIARDTIRSLLNRTYYPTGSSSKVGSEGHKNPSSSSFEDLMLGESRHVIRGRYTNPLFEITDKDLVSDFHITTGTSRETRRRAESAPMEDTIACEDVFQIVKNVQDTRNIFEEVSRFSGQPPLTSSQVENNNRDTSSGVNPSSSKAHHQTLTRVTDAVHGLDLDFPNQGVYLPVAQVKIDDGRESSKRDFVTSTLFSKSSFGFSKAPSPKRNGKGRAPKEPDKLISINTRRCGLGRTSKDAAGSVAYKPP